MTVDVPEGGGGGHPWEAPDGTCWFYFPPWREWTGWQPHEGGHWQLTIEEFRAAYPDAPAWDGWTLTRLSALRF